MNWSRSWSKSCDSDRIVPNPSRRASGPWCWVGRSVMFLFDCWLAGWLIHLQPWVLDGRSVMFLFDCWPVGRPMLRTVRGCYKHGFGINTKVPWFNPLPKTSLAIKLSTSFMQSQNNWATTAPITWRLNGSPEFVLKRQVTITQTIIVWPRNGNRIENLS